MAMILLFLLIDSTTSQSLFSSGAPSTMNAWIEGKGFGSTAAPKAGDLHRKFTELPSECEVGRLTQRAILNILRLTIFL